VGGVLLARELHAHLGVEEVVEEVVVEAAAADSDVDEPPAPAEPSPFDREGDWYVVHTYAGYENKVKSNLLNRIRSMHVEERIFEVVIPMEDVIEFKGGQRRVVQKKVFPGYLLVRMDLDDVACKAAKDAGVKLAVSTDAHSREQLDFMRLGIGQARRAWLEAGDVLNTLRWKRLAALLQRK